MPTAKELQELMDWYRQKTPSAPDWYHGIDHVVGVMLAAEIERAKEREGTKE